MQGAALTYVEAAIKLISSVPQIEMMSFCDDALGMTHEGGGLDLFRLF